MRFGGLLLFELFGCHIARSDLAVLAVGAFYLGGVGGISVFHAVAHPDIALEGANLGLNLLAHLGAGRVGGGDLRKGAVLEVLGLVDGAFVAVGVEEIVG